MSDDLSSSPPRMPVTAEWLAEQQRKQAAYTESRRRYHRRLAAGEADELDEAAPDGSPAAVLPRRRSRGKVYDPRQLKLEL